MTTALLMRMYLVEYLRRPLNVVLLVVVPVLLVALSADAFAEFAGIVGSIGSPDSLAAPTAGWAAGFLAGVSGFFLVVGSRQPDRRLVGAGVGSARLVAARLGTGLLLVLVAATAALVTLWLRTDLPDPLRAVGGTLMFAVIYLAIGIAVGSMVDNPVNGSLIVIFIWMLDVFLGPAMAGGDVLLTRFFPTHFVTLILLDSASGHGGPIGDIGWALLWVTASVIVSAAIFYATTRRRRHRRRRLGYEWPQRALTAFRFVFREYRRIPAMWILLVLLPVLFISLSFYITPDAPAPVQIKAGGRETIVVLSMIDVHGAIMVPITVAFLSGLAGLFVVQGSLQADRRLALAGYRSSEILAARLGVVTIAALLVTAVSLAVTAIDFAPPQWPLFAASNLLVALEYGMIGVITGTLFGRLGGLYMMFLMPFIDVGIAQNVMFSAAPPAWGRFLPAHGPVRLMVDGAFTDTFDDRLALTLTLGWLTLLFLIGGAIFHRIASPEKV